jgi:hypothetical protein
LKFNPETKRQWCGFNFPRQKTVRAQKIARQDNADRYFDAAGIIYLELVPAGTTVKSHYYFVVLKRLYVDVYRVIKEPFRNNGWLPLLDKVPAYLAVECEDISCFQIDLYDPASHLLTSFVTGKFFPFPKVNGS